MIKSESTTDYGLTRGFTENGARNAELNSIIRELLFEALLGWADGGTGPNILH